MKKKVLQKLLPLLVLAAMVAGCGKNGAAVETTEIVSEATEATATEETEITETEDTETEVTEEPETQETETQEPTEEAETEVSTEEKQTDISKETNTTTKETASSSESTTTAPQAKETPQAEVAQPAETSSQPVEQTQIVTSSADQITQGSTGTTSLGTTYPIVSEFNKLGLDPDSNGWFSSDGMASSFSEAMGQANRAISDVLGYPSDFAAISATNTYINCLDAHISRKPESGYYVWVYADDLTDDSDGGVSSRALHQVILGAITSTPAEVEAALFEAMWGDDPYNIGSCQWVTVGDCKILYAYGNPNEGEWRYEFAIKPAN